MSRPMPDAWHDALAPDHFWCRWRLRVLERLLRRLGLRLSEPLRVLDVGCGRGGMRRELESRGVWTVDGVDTDPQAVAANPPLRGRAMHGCLDSVPRPEHGYDAVLVFDVLEHLEDDQALLVQARALLRPGGALLVNVPAIPWARGSYDRAVGHLRRYDRAMLRRALAGAGFSGPVLRPWAAGLVPLLLLRNALSLLQPDEEAVVRSGFTPPGRLANTLLDGLGRAECRLFPALPFGASIMGAGTAGNGEADEPGEGK